MSNCLRLSDISRPSPAPTDVTGSSAAIVPNLDSPARVRTTKLIVFMSPPLYLNARRFGAPLCFFGHENTAFLSLRPEVFPQPPDFGPNNSILWHEVNPAHLHVVRGAGTPGTWESILQHLAIQFRHRTGQCREITRAKGLTTLR